MRPMSAAKHREDEMEGGRIEEEEKSMTVPVTGLINGCLVGGGVSMVCWVKRRSVRFQRRLDTDEAMHSTGPPHQDILKH